MQNAFNRLMFLVYFNRIKVLYFDIDVFKKHDFDIMIYHIKRKNNMKSKIISTSFKRMKIEFIMFLNKILLLVENRY